jgi:DNA-binding GntR family transcriptional regulator
MRDLRETLMVREALEGVACRLAAQNLTDEDLSELSALVDRHEESMDRDASASNQSPDFDFHQRIIRASDNQQLIRLLCEDLFYLLRVHRYRSAAVPGRAKQALAEHRVILAALKARDAEGAENAMRRHLRHAYLNLFANSGDASAASDTAPDVPAATEGPAPRIRTRRQAGLTDAP